MQNAAGHLLSLGDLPLLAEGLVAGAAGLPQHLPRSRPSSDQLCRRAYALSGVAAYEAQA